MESYGRRQGEKEEGEEEEKEDSENKIRYWWNSEEPSDINIKWSVSGARAEKNEWQAQSTGEVGGRQGIDFFMSGKVCPTVGTVVGKADLSNYFHSFSCWQDLSQERSN